MSQPYSLRESTGSKPSKVDWGKGIIYGVKVLAEDSRNGFVYPRATRLKAHPLFENLRVNIDHLSSRKKGEDVPYAARFGKLVNVREGDRGTFADLKFNPKHALAESIAYAAEHLDDTLGMSINGVGHGTARDAQGRKIVESISALRSCDVVADPGSTHTLFESQQMSEELPGSDPGVAASLTGMKAAVTHLVENAADEAALVAALTAWVEKYAAPEDEESDVEESEKTFERLKAERECLVLCESEKVTPTSALIDLLADLTTEDKRKTLLTQWAKGTAPKPAPRSGPPIKLQESQQAPAKPADPVAERKRLAGVLRGRA